MLHESIYHTATVKNGEIKDIKYYIITVPRHNEFTKTFFATQAFFPLQKSYR